MCKGLYRSKHRGCYYCYHFLLFVLFGWSGLIYVIPGSFQNKCFCPCLSVLFIIFWYGLFDLHLRGYHYYRNIILVVLLFHYFCLLPTYFCCFIQESYETSITEDKQEEENIIPVREVGWRQQSKYQMRRRSLLQI